MEPNISDIPTDFAVVIESLCESRFDETFYNSLDLVRPQIQQVSGSDKRCSSKIFYNASLTEFCSFSVTNILKDKYHV